MTTAASICQTAYAVAYKAELAASKSTFTATAAARLAFRQVMPGLDSATEIRAFIGCIAAGVLLRVFEKGEGSQLLYAAQIAMSVEKEERSKHANSHAKPAHASPGDAGSPVSRRPGKK